MAVIICNNVYDQKRTFRNFRIRCTKSIIYFSFAENATTFERYTMQISNLLLVLFGIFAIFLPTGADMTPKSLRRPTTMVPPSLSLDTAGPPSNDHNNQLRKRNLHEEENPDNFIDFITEGFETVKNETIYVTENPPSEWSQQQLIGVGVAAALVLTCLCCGCCGCFSCGRRRKD